MIPLIFESCDTIPHTDLSVYARLGNIGYIDGKGQTRV